MSRSLAIASVAAAALVLAGSPASTQNAPPTVPAPPAVSNAPAPFAMTMGDMMNTLIQPRHAKLGLAGQAQNWALAAYALREIQQGFTAISKSIPRWRGLPVPELVEAAVSEPIKAVNAAIKQQDEQKFAAAYTQLTQGCNACHTTADHPFVVIKAPDASNFPNQEFAPKR